MAELNNAVWSTAAAHLTDLTRLDPLNVGDAPQICGALNDVIMDYEVTKEEQSDDELLRCARFSKYILQGAIFVLYKHRRGDRKFRDYAHVKQWKAVLFRVSLVCLWIDKEIGVRK